MIGKAILDIPPEGCLKPLFLQLRFGLNRGDLGRDPGIIHGDKGIYGLIGPGV